MATIYIDTNIIIYQVEGTPSAQKAASALVMRCLPGDQKLATSEITLAECLLGAEKRQNMVLAAKYREILTDPETFNLIPVDRRILEHAAIVGAQYKLKLVDAIHVATAFATGCEIFLTNDLNIKIIDRMRIVRLSES